MATGTGIVFINSKGQYLRVYEVSAHTSKRVYSADWNQLKYATIFPKNYDIQKVRENFPLKNPSEDALDQAIIKIFAEEIRSVQLIDYTE